MYDYLLANQRSLLNRRTMQFEQIRGRLKMSDIEVPTYLWTFGKSHDTSNSYMNSVVGGKVRRYSLTYRKSDTIRLNCFEFKFKSNRHIEIMLRDDSGGVKTKLTVQYSLQSTAYMSAGRRYSSLCGASYLLTVGDDQRLGHSTVIEQHAFDIMPNLGYEDLGGAGSDRIYFGISDVPLKVHYRGKHIGESYAMMCGTCAILLGDDMTFDTLAYLSRASRDTIVIDKFAYTTNTYVLKLMMLGR